jgi:hypothetical protein
VRVEIRSSRAALDGERQDGQFLKLDRNGKVLGAIGNGMGIGHGQFIEASYWVFDKQNNLYAGDTSVGRVTKWSRPGRSRASLVCLREDFPGPPWFHSPQTLEISARPSATILLST